MKYATSELHWAFATFYDLKRLTANGNGATPSQLSRATGLPRQSIYRGLKKLRSMGMAELTGKARWALTAQAREAA